MSEVNRQWLLAKRPVGLVQESDFELVSNPIPAPAGSPAIFLVANNKYMWLAPANDVPIASGQPDNDDSIGLVIRFNTTQGKELTQYGVNFEFFPK